VVQNLLDCVEENRPDNAYDSLDAAIKDLHLLLLDPSRFLFNHEDILENNGSAQQQLLFREDTLYGREKEVSLITDAFCRVSSGKSEAFFIGGFSGSGKSRLVNSLTARIDAVEGYVLTHKFDEKSERPLLEVISVFNDLCLLIKEKVSPQAIVQLMDAFGTDLSVLARLLPNIEVLTPQLKQNGDKEKESGDQMNLQGVCFALQRFMRVVSSASRPVMLFLDDLQWCDASALRLVEGILCDVIGSSHLFFVGSYRSNEVQDDHAIFSLIDRLNASGVPTTKLSLEGLNPADLNSLVSDALCTFPRICEPLSDVVFQKTKGNPFFVLEFLRSLVDRGLLEYSIQKRSWVWDEDNVSSMDVTGNVLHLLSSKMSGLSEHTQLALKVAACFGIKLNGSVVSYLCTSSEYSTISDGLGEAVREGFMMKVGSSDFKFSHDKVREAAYSLIPDSEKNQVSCGDQ
jgi:predicted ATPase